MKHSILLATMWLFTIIAPVGAQTQLTTQQVESLYDVRSGSSISIHDPSVVLRNGTYTVWGSHLGVAQSTDLVNWTPLTAGASTFVKLAKQGASSGTNCNHSQAFNIQQVSQVRDCTGATVDFPNIDAEAYAARYAENRDKWIDGDMWAPDIIYNREMNRWCMYLSINGDHWSSIIILLTAQQPTGPWTYQGPVVMGGFHGQTINGVAPVSIGETDYTIATGEKSFAQRYKQEHNGTFWPNCIDPCVFYDEEGQLWMTYGSWSGGIWMLQLDGKTGLRDYTHTYTSNWSGTGSVTEDPYFGHKIAGGYYVSGEGSYIQHIGQYYYLFMSYGAFGPNDGYEMRVFRSDRPDGPYVDASGTPAIYQRYELNYGPSASSDRGMLLMSAYNHWGELQAVGQRAQGHNSAITDEQGRSFVMYHTKFNDGTIGHQVRVHQLFVNEQGWLVAAPFAYQGEQTTDESIASSCPWTMEQLAGEYQVLMHRYRLDHNKAQELEPTTMTLTADGKVQGSVTGTWSLTPGTAYITLRLGSKTYRGVLCQQHINGASARGYLSSNLSAIAFTSTTQEGTPLWGYKLSPESAIALNMHLHPITINEGQVVSSNLSLMYDGVHNTTIAWTSSHPDIISSTGKYNPRGLAEPLPMTLTARVACGDCYWEQTYNVRAQKETLPTADYMSGLVAYYDFNEKPTYNHYKPAMETTFDRVTYGKFGNGIAPVLESDYERDGQYVHQYFGANGTNSYTRIPNPLAGNTSLEGATISMWVKPMEENAWDALWSFFNATSSSSTSSPRLYLTGNAYVGYNDAAGMYFDINHPDKGTYQDIPVGRWSLVTLTIGPTSGVRLYVNGTIKSTHSVTCSDGTTKAGSLPVLAVLQQMASMRYFYLGNGSFWGSADACMDDLMIYNRELSASEVRALNTMSNRVTDFTTGENGDDVPSLYYSGNHQGHRTMTGTYDLQGRRYHQGVPTQQGVYIQNGRKVVR